MAQQPILAPRSYGRCFALGLLRTAFGSPHHVASPLALIRLYIEPPGPTPIRSWWATRYPSDKQTNTHQTAWSYWPFASQTHARPDTHH